MLINITFYYNVSTNKNFDATPEILKDANKARSVITMRMQPVETLMLLYLLAGFESQKYKKIVDIEIPILFNLNSVFRLEDFKNSYILFAYL